MEVIKATDTVIEWDVPEGMEMTIENLNNHALARTIEASQVLDPEAFVIS